MKTIFLLPGNTPANKDWIDEVGKNFASDFEVTIKYYSHWKTGDELIDINKELESVSNYDFVFAKSAGVLLALSAINRGIITPQACIFVGTPKLWADENELQLNDLIRNYNVPTLFAQKTKDPVFSYEQLKAYLESNKVENYKLVEISGDNHHYENIEQLKDLFLNFIQNGK